MKKAIDVLQARNSSSTLGLLDKVQRQAYLNSKGINSGQQYQLDLIFPDTIGQANNLRHIPNDYARSSLFTVSNRKQQRKTLMQEKLFHYNEHIEILYTGIELRAEDDELVWLQILKYGEYTAMGEPFQFTVRDMVKDLGWVLNGRSYDRVRECITRLKATEVLAFNSKAYGKSGAISLIQSYEYDNDGSAKPNVYRVWINPDLIVLFAGNTFTSHSWEFYRQLSPVARRLTDWIASHKHPYPLSLEKFRKMCGSNNANSRSWRQTVKNACKELENSDLAQYIKLQNDQIYCLRDEKGKS